MAVYFHAAAAQSVHLFELDGRQIFMGGSNGPSNRLPAANLSWMPLLELIRPQTQYDPEF